MAKSGITLGEKRKEWLEILRGTDTHAIDKQIRQIAWRMASFTVVNEARGLARPSRDGGVQLNGLMHNLLDRCFFDSQMVAIRRLVDTLPLDGERGVYSMIGLLKDMLKHQAMFTRRAMLEAEGLRYEFGDAAPMDHQSFMSKLRHKQIDRLVGVAAAARQPGDAVPSHIFTNLKGKVKTACDEVTLHVNKFVAHAATPESRASADADMIGVTLNHLWGAHESLCHVCGFLAIDILGDACGGFLAIPQYDQFRYMERALCTKRNIPTLEKTWKELDKRYRDLSQWNMDGYRKEFGG